jgi:hypothetical protein
MRSASHMLLDEVMTSCQRPRFTVWPPSSSLLRSACTRKRGCDKQRIIFFSPMPMRCIAASFVIHTLRAPRLCAARAGGPSGGGRRAPQVGGGGEGGDCVGPVRPFIVPPIPSLRAGGGSSTPSPAARVESSCLSHPTAVRVEPMVRVRQPPPPPRGTAAVMYWCSGSSPPAGGLPCFLPCLAFPFKVFSQSSYWWSRRTAYLSARASDSSTRKCR